MSIHVSNASKSQLSRGPHPYGQIQSRVVRLRGKIPLADRLLSVFLRTRDPRPSTMQEEENIFQTRNDDCIIIRIVSRTMTILPLLPLFDSIGRIQREPASNKGLTLGRSNFRPHYVQTHTPASARAHTHEFDFFSLPVQNGRPYVGKSRPNGF
jgi:hypothetical protein